MSRIRIGVLALLVFVVACSEETAPPDPGPVPVKIIEISSSDLAATHTRSFFGTIASERSSGLAFEVGGRITEIYFDAGAFVEKDALLAQLDDADFVAAVRAARSDFETAEQDHKRSNELAQQGAESQERLEAAKRRMESARARLTLTENSLANTRLIAPSDGYIGRRLAEVSDSVVAKQQIMILQTLGARRIRAIIPETDITLSTYLLPLKDGVADARPSTQINNRIADARPRIVLSIYPEREFPGEFVALTTAANPVTRTLTMTMQFTAPDDILVIAGTSAKLLLNVPNEKAGLVSIPAIAIAAGNGDSQFVWAVDVDGRIAVKSVDVERIAGDQVQVSGLTAGDRIVASGVAHLRDGDIVTAFER